MASEMDSPFLGGRTNLGRIFSFRYLYHRWVAAIAILTGLVASVYAVAGGATLMEALGRGANAGAAAFFAWVLARELDPPRQWTGLVAAVLGGLALILIGPVALLASGFLILPLRLVNHAAGFRSNQTDSAAVAFFGLIATLLTGEWLPAAASVLALILDGLLDSKGQGRQWLWAAAAALGTLIYFYIAGWPVFALPGTPELAITGLAALFSLVRLARRPDLGPDDRGRPLDFRRAAWGVALALMVALGSLWIEDGLVGYAPLWAALLGVGF